jgi:hypothetical protein
MWVLDDSHNDVERVLPSRSGRSCGGLATGTGRGMGAGAGQLFTDDRTRAEHNPHPSREHTASGHNAQDVRPME